MQLFHVKTLLSWFDNYLDPFILAFRLCRTVDCLRHKEYKIITHSYSYSYSFLLQCIASFTSSSIFVSSVILSWHLRISSNLLYCLCVADSLGNLDSLHLCCSLTNLSPTVSWTMLLSTIATFQLCPLCTLAILTVSTTSTTPLLSLAHRLHMSKSLTCETCVSGEGTSHIITRTVKIFSRSLFSLKVPRDYHI